MGYDGGRGYCYYYYDDDDDDDGGAGGKDNTYQLVKRRVRFLKKRGVGVELYCTSKANLGAGIRTPKSNHILTSISQNLHISANIYFRHELQYNIQHLKYMKN